MGIPRRSLLLTAAAASTAGLLPPASARAAGSPPGDVVGRITVGYQGCFACPGDGAPINGWWHWSQDWSHAPSPGNNALRAWPDMREYTAGHGTAYGPLGDGTPAVLFSSYDQQTVDTHFRWMREYGCDTAALQRFDPNGGEGATRDAVTAKVRSAAEADRFLADVQQGDQADCNARGIDYQPCVLPGEVSERQRAHGDFMWRQFYNTVRLGAQGLYVSMFDEFNEGNQIAKTAESAAVLPADSGLLALDEDGTACSSDHYLRLTADGGRMLKGQLALTPVRPTPPTTGDTTPPPPAGDLALHRPTAESSHTQVYGSGNAVDGDPNSYWESANSAFPQWLQVDLQTVHPVRRPVLAVPPAPAWAARTRTVAVLGSTDGAAFTTPAGAAGYRFDPATGNTAVLTLPAAVQTRYLRLQFTGNTGWPAGQLSALQVFAQ
ncbi:discoidin domain-containing protein [Kitasatospora sp. NPDC085895]|uniref:discoidin domain-containing protein n=1 Tax=Kitasatospora sp. NPDC085895 TaxID=3155057 RepID=UPI00344B7296